MNLKILLRESSLLAKTPHPFLIGPRRSKISCQQLVCYKKAIFSLAFSFFKWLSPGSVGFPLPGNAPFFIIVKVRKFGSALSDFLSTATSEVIQIKFENEQ